METCVTTVALQKSLLTKLSRASCKPHHIGSKFGYLYLVIPCDDLEDNLTAVLEDHCWSQY